MITGAYFYPLPNQLRVRSDIEVVANGGRKEDFYIHLDRDRITQAQQDLVAAFPAQGIHADLFKLRNTSGKVIGLASRMTSLIPDANGEFELAVNWLLLLPSRGSFLLSQNPSSLSPALAEGANLELNIQQGRMVVGDREFSELAGSYVEMPLSKDTDGDGKAESVLLLSTLLVGVDPA